MSPGDEPDILEGVEIRTYEPADQQAVHRLYEEGRLSGQVQPNDTAADIDNIPEAYLNEERAHFWVAEYEGRVVGTVGVAEDEPHLAQIRRLRVDPDYRDRGIGAKLMETALQFCRHHGYLKVVLDTGFEEGAAIELFDRFAFQHHRSRSVGGKPLIEFYLDLYRDPDREE